MGGKIILFYERDDILYPVVLTEEQDNAIQAIMLSIFDEENKLKVCFDMPQGKIVNLADTL